MTSTEPSPIAPNFPNQQEYYRHLYKRIKPSWEESLALYIKAVDHSVQSDTHVLDIGCGHSNFLQEVYTRTSFTYGIDPDADALASNTIIKHPTVGSVEALPFEDTFFDLVILSWVMEHLKQPQRAFQEIHRVLKPGGRVIFLTPNTWNYNVWLIRLIPNRLHGFLVRRLYNRQEQDTYPVQYRINSPRAIQSILSSTGFRKVQVILHGDPTYIRFNKPLFFLARLLETILDLPYFHFARVHIVGIYEKPVTSCS